MSPGRRRGLRGTNCSLLRRRSPPRLNGPLLIWTALLLAANVIFFIWFLDESLPWMAKNGGCRGPFLVLLPITILHCIFCFLDIRSYFEARARERR